MKTDLNYIKKLLKILNTPTLQFLEEVKFQVKLMLLKTCSPKQIKFLLAVE